MLEFLNTRECDIICVYMVTGQLVSKFLAAFSVKKFSVASMSLSWDIDDCLEGYQEAEMLSPLFPAFS